MKYEEFKAGTKELEKIAPPVFILGPVGSPGHAELDRLKDVVPAREQVKAIISTGISGDIPTESILTAIDLVISDFIGEDDTEDAQMPIHWNQALKKQYVNFRNHLRRSLRAKWSK